MSLNKKNLALVFLALTIILFQIITIIATSGSLGGGVAIIRSEVGEKLSRSVLLINPNDFAVKVNVTITQDSENEVTLTEKIVDLKPNEQKKFYFDINVKKPGKRQIKLGFLYVPEKEGENTIGLSTKYTLIVGDEYDFNYDETDDEGNVEVSGIEETIEKIKVSGNEIRSKISSISPGIYLLILTPILLVIFLVLLIKSSSKKNDK